MVPRNNVEFLLGIDAGTTLIKSVLFNLEGAVVAKAAASIPLEHPRPEWAEQDMEEVWVATARTIREVLKAVESVQGKVLAVSVSGQGGGLWLVDEKGRPVRKAVTWLDGRARDTIAEWQAAGILKRLEDITGYHLFPGVGPLTLFHWFKRFEPEALEKAHKNLWAKDWVKFRLTGEITTDETDPSNGHIECGQRAFSREVFELAGVADCWELLPPVVPSWQVIGAVTGAASEETGLKEGTPVASGAWDVSSTALGAGCIQDGQALTILGTAGIHLTVASQVSGSSEAPYSVCAHCVPGQWVVNSMAMTATANLDWFVRELSRAEAMEAGEDTTSLYQKLNEKVASVPPGARGIIYLPFILGERAPFVKPEATALFFGITAASEWEDLLRAVYEGVAFSTLHNYEALEVVTPIREVVLAGGGSKSAIWSQIMADCTGKRMKVPSGEEFGARGAAMNAGVAVGAYADHYAAAASVRYAREHVPSPESTETYAKVYSLYRLLIKSLWTAWEEASLLR
ncbi:MAG: FGGY-family carbohydrate kinase [Anaerolineae bacterium]